MDKELAKLLAMLALQTLLLVPVMIIIIVCRVSGMNHWGDEVEDWFLHL